MEWYYKNRERQLLKMKEWKLKNKDKVKKYEIKWRTEDRKKYLSYKKNMRLKHQESIKAYRKREDVKKKQRERVALKRKLTNRYYDNKYEEEHKEERKAYRKSWSQRPEVKARRNLLARIWNKNNPRSNGIKDLDVRYAMNNVRLRDKNTCQWQGCGLTFKEAPIHVHHIFPRSEYPELELVESYMICYCANHHGLFHRYRGDHYSEMIGKRTYEDPLQEKLD